MPRRPNPRIAGRKTRQLFIRATRATHEATVHVHLEGADRIGQTICRHWQIGPYEWDVKHVRWYLATQIRTLSPATQYRYWLTIRALVCALGKDTDWLPQLNGPWLRPTGKRGPPKSGRPPRLLVRSVARR